MIGRWVETSPPSWRHLPLTGSRYRVVERVEQLITHGRRELLDKNMCEDRQLVDSERK